MKTSLSLLPLLLLAACATPPDGRSTPALARLSPEELQKLVRDQKPPVTLSEIVAWSRAGEGAEAIVARLKSAGARNALTPKEVLDLSAQGVPTAVLEYLHDAREAALRADLETILADREREHAEAQEKAVAAERNRSRLYYDPWFRPYYWPWGPRWGGGVYRRW